MNSAIIAPPSWFDAAQILQDLERGQKLGLTVMAVLPAASDPERQDHRQTHGDGEIEIELGAGVEIAMVRPVGSAGRHGPGEQRRAEVIHVESGGSKLGEAD